MMHGILEGAKEVGHMNTLWNTIELDGELCYHECIHTERICLPFAINSLPGSGPASGDVDPYSLIDRSYDQDLSRKAISYIKDGKLEYFGGVIAQQYNMGLALVTIDWLKGEGPGLEFILGDTLKLTPGDG